MHHWFCQLEENGQQLGPCVLDSEFSPISLCCLQVRTLNTPWAATGATTTQNTGTQLVEKKRWKALRPSFHCNSNPRRWKPRRPTVLGHTVRTVFSLTSPLPLQTATLRTGLSRVSSIDSQPGRSQSPTHCTSPVTTTSQSELRMTFSPTGEEDQLIAELVHMSWDIPMIWRNGRNSG